MEKITLDKSMERYPEYKDSGVAWLGEIPADWKIVPIKSFAFKVKEVGFPDEKLLSIYREHGIVPKESRQDNYNRASEDLSSYQLVRPGELVLNKMKTWQGSLAVSDHRGIVSPAYIKCILDHRKVYARFIHHTLRGVHNISRYRALSYGIRPSQWDMHYEDFKRIGVALPDPDIQKRIADYLDEKTIAIDAVIAQKRRLIDLLNEKRASLINEVLEAQKGRKTKLKYTCLINPSKSQVANLPNTAVGFVPMQNVSEKGKMTAEQKKLEDVYSGYTYFKNGDVVLAKITPCFENGKAAVVDMPFSVGFGSTEFIVLRPLKSLINPYYLYFLVHSEEFRKKGELGMTGTAGQKRLTDDFVRNYEFILPELPIQQQTTDHLNDKTKEVDGAIEQIDRSVKLLQEYRSSLISNVVTGKIKV